MANKKMFLIRNFYDALTGLELINFNNKIVSSNKIIILLYYSLYALIKI